MVGVSEQQGPWNANHRQSSGNKPRNTFIEQNQFNHILSYSMKTTCTKSKIKIYKHNRTKYGFAMLL